MNSSPFTLTVRVIARSVFGELDLPSGDTVNTLHDAKVPSISCFLFEPAEYARRVQLFRRPFGPILRGVRCDDDQQPVPSRTRARQVLLVQLAERPSPPLARTS